MAAANLELYELSNDTELRNRIAVSAAKKAWGWIDSGTATPQQADWSLQMMRADQGAIEVVLRCWISEQSGNELALIMAATDATLDSEVSDIVDDILTADTIINGAGA